MFMSQVISYSNEGMHRYECGQQSYIQLTSDISQQSRTEPYGDDEGSSRYSLIASLSSLPSTSTGTPVPKSWHFSWHASDEYEEREAPSAPAAPVPASVGSTVGVLVGEGSGAAVGAGTGAAVGEGIGAAVGSGTGAAVGEGTGAAVGLFVGALVGLFVGALVGEGTGAGVGALVGLFVGAFVGLLVGDLVGAFVATSAADSGSQTPPDCSQPSHASVWIHPNAFETRLYTPGYSGSAQPMPHETILL